MNSENDDTEIGQDADKLARSVMWYVQSNELLIHLVARLINQYDVKDDKTRHDLQRAYGLCAQARKQLEEIGFFETIT